MNKSELVEGLLKKYQVLRHPAPREILEKCTSIFLKYYDPETHTVDFLGLLSEGRDKVTRDEMTFFKEIFLDKIEKETSEDEI